MIPSAIHLCLPLLSERTLQQELQSGQEYLAEHFLPAADRVYIGSENCEYLLCRKRSGLEQNARLLLNEGYHVTLVTPPVTQSVFQEVFDLVRFFDQENLADEVIFNDVGLLRRCSESDLQSSFRLGRHFDKLVREGRFKPEEIDEIKCNKSIFETPWIRQNTMADDMKRYRVSGIEIDPVPGAVLSIEDNPLSCAIWYPGILLSYCTTCEFAGLNLPADQKFFPGRCACECEEYYTEKHGNSYMKIVKMGRSIQAVDHRNFTEIAKGEYRAVVSLAFRRYCR